MPWFAAHVIVRIKPVKQPPGVYPVYENVLLLESSSADEALQKARNIGQDEERLEDNLLWNDQPATREFVGVRKVVQITNTPERDDADPPADGTEVTYSLFELSDEESVKDLARGKLVHLRYVD